MWGLEYFLVGTCIFITDNNKKLSLQEERTASMWKKKHAKIKKVDCDNSKNEGNSIALLISMTM